MATTAAGAQLTEEHRATQLAVRAGFLRELVRIWPLITLENLDETAAEWIGLVTDLIMAFRGQSAGRALNYYERFRLAETGEELEQRELYANLGLGSTAAFRTSLLVTGPVNVKSRLAKGFTPERAKAMALVDVAGAASRHVLNGGRQMLTEATEKDLLAVRYTRVTDGSPCAFCAMLASRGPVYKSEDTGLRTTSRSRKRGPGQEYHDHCACSVEPGFFRDEEWPGSAREFEQIWKDTTAGKSGKSALNAFRNAYEKQRPKKSS